MRFWDASAILPLCLTEAQSDVLMNLLKEDRGQVVWWGTRVECSSALARMEREGLFDPRSSKQAGAVLKALAEAWTEVLPTNNVRQAAERLLRIHSLKAADSLQLAAALIWTDRNPVDREFVCLDRQLRRAADLEGFDLQPSE